MTEVSARAHRIEVLRKRIAECTPKQRELLEKMLEREGVALHGEAAGKEDRDASSVASVQAFDSGSGDPGWTWAERPTKEQTRHQYDSYHDACNSTVFGQHSFFMNLGYFETDLPQLSPIDLGPHVVNRNSMKLALELIGDADLNGCDVLDVGSGRGGTIHTIHTYYKPRSTLGVDLSPNGVAFCRVVHRFPNALFEVGDAENLPAEDTSRDFVTNLESSHSYPNRPAFYAEVYRVLRVGGAFLYSDVLPVDAFREALADLAKLGFTLELDRDITPNVLASCEDSAEAQFQAFAEDDNDNVMADALGVPGSKVYEDMRAGVATFRITRLRKTASR